MKFPRLIIVPVGCQQQAARDMSGQDAIYEATSVPRELDSGRGVRVPIRATRSIFQPSDAGLFAVVENLVASLAGYFELPTHLGHFLPFEEPCSRPETLGIPNSVSFLYHQVSSGGGT